MKTAKKDARKRATCVTDVTDADDEYECTPPKKTRGRPRKNKHSSANDTSNIVPERSLYVLISIQKVLISNIT